MNKIKVNYIVDAILGLSFIVTAVTGMLLFIFMPSGVRQGRLQEFLGVTKETWTFYHDWAGIIMIALALVHLILHWNWIVCMTKSFFKKNAAGDSCETSDAPKKKR
ncbi:DUF4405 domain-containing protein [Candidatus Woesearchaeota archaeon]|nr:DUF4405 domain-containing protein [Candidatus Woesearchaeota archaeon]